MLQWLKWQWKIWTISKAISESSSNDQETNTRNGNEQNDLACNLETASIVAIEASNKVKLLMAKFDNQ